MINDNKLKVVTPKNKRKSIYKKQSACSLERRNERLDLCMKLKKKKKT